MLEVASDQMERLFRSRFSLERYEAHEGQASLLPSGSRT